MAWIDLPAFHALGEHLEAMMQKQSCELLRLAFTYHLRCVTCLLSSSDYDTHLCSLVLHMRIISNPIAPSTE